MSEHVFAFANGDKVRVKAEPTHPKNELNGRSWPAGYEGYIAGHGWSDPSRDEDEHSCAMYSFYVERDHPAWGMQFAEADLELVEKRY